MNFKKIGISLLASLLLLSNTAFANLGGMSTGITEPNYWTKIGDAVNFKVNTWTLGSTTNRVSKIWATDVDVSGLFTFGGTMVGDLDMDGNDLVNAGNVGLIDTTGNFNLNLKINEALTVASKALTFVVGDADRSITLQGNPTLNDWFNQSVKTTASPNFAGIDLTDTVATTLKLSLRTTNTAISANRTLTIDAGNTDKTITLSGSPTLSDWFDQSVKTTASPTFSNITATTNVSTSNGFIFTSKDLLQYTTTAVNDSGNAYTFANAAGSTYRQAKVSSLYVSPTNTAGAGRAMIDTKGNFGSGTTTPTARLHINQPTTGIGTVSISGTAVTGSGTQFTNTFRVGDTITATTSSGAETKTITAVTSDTVLATDAFAGTATNVAFTLVGGDRFMVYGNGNFGFGSGSVLNFGLGDYTLTHSTGLLTASGNILNNGLLGSSAIIVPESLGSNILTDGGVEAWDDADTLTSWVDAFGGAPGAATIAQESTEVYEGTYSVKFTTDAVTDEGKYIAQEKTGLTAGDNYRLQYYAKEATGTASFQTLVMNGVLGVATQVYNFTTGAWVDGTGAGGVVDPGSGDIGADNLQEKSITNAFAQYTNSDIPIPANGTLVVAIVAQGAGGAALDLYLDAITLKKVTAATTVTAHDFYSANDHDNYTASDYVFKFRSTAGTPRTQFGLSGNGVFETYFSTFNFGAKDIETGGDVFADNATLLTQLSTPKIVLNGLNQIGYNDDVEDDAYLDLPDATSGWGEVMVGDNEERARFSWTTEGVVTLMENTANVVDTDTDDKFCIFDNGTTVRVRNRLGSTKGVKLFYKY